ncbi:hypothetical protein F5Y09DRAFT_306281 [Xylaria sp. FL1042]|nr:hypothetical protein F5Y09DRAFT_306281 [Xylaria sp. FL1042]
MEIDEPREGPPGQVLRSTPRPQPRVTQSFDKDDKISFETSSDESGLLLNPDRGLIDNQDRSKDNIQGTFSIPEQNTYQSDPSLNKCLEAQIKVDYKKRKSPEVDISVVKKKARLNEDTSRRSQSSGHWQLPAEIWQHIFIFLPPKMLGRLLSVNKCFNSFLNPSSPYSHDAPSPALTGSLSNLKPEVIWQLSRRRFWPTMPTPLRGYTELRMWQLACQGGCQFCDRTDQQNPSPHDSPNSGYKSTGPRPVWPFALRSCESCLVSKVTKEIDLLLSSSVPSFLIPAIPFVFISDDMQIIPSAMLQTGQATLELSITKVFLSSHVTAIHEEFSSVRAMGEATAEEWLKGLEGRGKELRADSLRWEKFEMSGGLIGMQQRLSFDNPRVTTKINEAVKRPVASIAVSPIETRGAPHQLSSSLDTPDPSFTTASKASRTGSAQEHQNLPRVNVRRRRTREKAEEMKAARRAEIERRAKTLEPPLLADVLALIPSFQAAIQITSPLDDTAWGLLKPRLVAQRGDIGQDQKEQMPTYSSANPKQSEDSQSLQRLTLEAKQHIDKIWDDAQAPLRAQISLLADQFIYDNWENGRNVNKDSSLQFAAEILLHVRRRFYAEIEKENTAARAAGKEPLCEVLNGPFTRKLTLENMRWLFDVKVKPFTEPYRKELFYCHGCEANNKLYGFEGVVQHYAAKHTTNLSLGSVVVHWRAEWPEVPPFHPEPHYLRSQLAGFPKLKSNEILGATPPIPQGQPLYQDGMMPDYEQPIPHSQYEVVGMQSLHGQTHPYIPPLGEYAHSFQGQAFQDHSNLLSNGNTYQGSPGLFHGGDLYGSVHAANINSHQSYNYTPYENYEVPEFQPTYNVQLPNLHHTKLEDIARNSRELWFSIAPLKELSVCIKIFIVIYHVYNRFRVRFAEEPPLDLFIEGLSNNKEMRPIRNINGLQCKACYYRLDVTTTANQDKESYSLPQLVRHFYQRHVEQRHALGVAVLDWSSDMIHLPDLRILSNLGSLTNIDDQKLAIINSAFSEATLRSSQIPTGQGHTAPSLRDRKISNPKRHPPDVHSSNKRALVQQPRIKQEPKSTRPNLTSVGIQNSGVRSRPSSSRAGHKSLKKRPSDTKTTSNTNPSIKKPSVRRSSIPVENDDDGFDLLAGLESQLDRQASSNRSDNLLERNT